MSEAGVWEGEMVAKRNMVIIAPFFDVQLSSIYMVTDNSRESYLYDGFICEHH